jgi:CBS domain-containing protein
MTEQHCGAIPIVRDGKLAGIITDRDIVCRVVAPGFDVGALKAADAMTKKVTIVDPDAHAEVAETVMRRRHLRRLPVIDASGRVVGIVSSSDLAAMTEELASGALYPKVARHVPKKGSARFRGWM